MSKSKKPKAWESVYSPGHPKQRKTKPQEKELIRLVVSEIRPSWEVAYSSRKILAEITQVYKTLFESNVELKPQRSPTDNEARAFWTGNIQLNDKVEDQTKYDRFKRYYEEKTDSDDEWFDSLTLEQKMYVWEHGEPPP